MTKRMLSMVLAGALVLSISNVSQAAVNPEDGKYSITVGSEVEVPTIEVELSDTSARKIAINPYGLEANIAGTVSGSPEQHEQLVNKVESITNKSEVALAVNVTVQATPAQEGKARLATAPVQSTEKANAIFAYLQLDVGDSIDADKEYNSKNENQIVFATKEASKKEMVTLKDKSQADGKKVSYKILGNVAANPAQMWTDADMVDFKIVFDFEPRVLR